ncbi:MAG: DJ-1/PfpI family protein [Anaerolineae bacterium]
MRAGIAFVIYDGMTALDFVGAYDPLTRLRTMGFMPDLSWQICALTEEVTDQSGLRFVPTQVQEPLGEYDLVLIPGGFGSRDLIDDAAFIEWLRSAAPCRLKASVCTGSLLLGAAGFLRGKKATTHPRAFDELRLFCSSVVHRRIVDEGDVITAGGVTASIDLGLYLCGRLTSRETEERIRKQIDYRG